MVTKDLHMKLIYEAVLLIPISVFVFWQARNAFPYCEFGTFYLLLFFFAVFSADAMDFTMLPHA